MHFWMLESLILVGIGYINLSGSLCTLTWYFCWLQNPGEVVLFWSWLPTWAGAVVKGCSFGSVNQVLDGAVFKWWQHWTVSLQNVWADRGCPVPEKNLFTLLWGGGEWLEGNSWTWFCCWLSISHLCLLQSRARSWKSCLAQSQGFGRGK